MGKILSGMECKMAFIRQCPANFLIYRREYFRQSIKFTGGSIDTYQLLQV